MRHALIAVTAVLAAASASFGAAWTPPAGSTSTFSYANGEDTNGRFGNALVDSSGFSFGPSTFLASRANGGVETVGDTASVEVTAAPGRTITSISATISGDFTILGTGSVDSGGILRVTNLDTMALLTVPLIFTGTPASTVTSTQGVFSGTVTIPLPSGTTRTSIQLGGSLTSTAFLNSSSLIQIKDAEILIATSVPEPTSALALAGVVLFARRSRR